MMKTVFADSSETISSQLFGGGCIESAKPFSQRALQGHRSAVVFAEDSKLPKYVSAQKCTALVAASL